MPKSSWVLETQKPRSRLPHKIIRDQLSVRDVRTNDQKRSWAPKKGCKKGESICLIKVAMLAVEEQLRKQLGTKVIDPAENTWGRVDSDLLFGRGSNKNC